ncbi:hypothetical protein [Roseimarinus sediminis]|jgi:hypothetical protein|uniref:hypothetical protein n=1 Tax=Roseimarinus sediminis TaxID=1610899 RepID=UPI003D20367C
MKQLKIEQLENIEGGISWDCARALAAVGLSVAAFLTMPAGAIAAMIWGGSHLLASYAFVKDCIISE